MTTAREWAETILSYSPTALKLLKASFNADTDHILGTTQMAMGALALYYRTPEAAEGHDALKARRTPNFRRFRT